MVKIVLTKNLIRNFVFKMKLRSILRSIIGDAMFFDIELMQMYELGLYNINAMYHCGDGEFEVKEIFDSSDVDRSICECVRRTEYYRKKYNPTLTNGSGGNDAENKTNF